jgi:hypothetical protein
MRSTVRDWHYCGGGYLARRGHFHGLAGHVDSPHRSARLRPLSSAGRWRTSPMGHRPPAKKWSARLDPYPDPLLTTLIPYRVEWRRPWRRCRRRWYPLRCEFRSIRRRGGVPRWRRRWRLALVGPHIARKVGIALRRADSWRRNHHSRHRNQRDREIGGKAANERHHRRTSSEGPALTSACLPIRPRHATSKIRYLV